MAGAFGVSTKRFGFVAMVLLLALFAFGSFAANDASAKGKKSKKAKVTISIVTKSQSNLLSSRKLKIKVKSTGKTKVSLSAAGNGKSNYFKKKKIKFKKKKKQTKTIKLVLNQNGVTALKKCGAPKIKVIGKYKKGKKKATAKKNKKLKKDSNRCITPVKPTCNPLDTKVCMQPWPNNFYTKSSDTNTGLQLDVPLDAMPKNTANAPIDLPDINRADGFSPGNLITTKIPAVETPAAFTNSGIVGATNMDAYDDPDQAVVVFDAATGERQPIYAELDANPTTLPVQALTPGEPPVDITGGYPNDNPTNTGDVNLLIRAAKNYKPGHRYIVVFRNLKDASNKAVEAAKPFKSCLDDAVVTDPGLLYTCNQLDDKVFSSLSKGDISRKNLYLAFDFTVASQENTTGRVLTIRNDAFSRLGDTDLADRKIQGTSPTVDVIAYCDQSDTGGAGCGNSDSKAPVPDSDVQRTVRGFIRNAPCYLNVDGCPSGSEFAFDSNGQLTWNPAYTVDIPFRCLIPKSVVASGTVVPGGTGIYGHGLLGTLNQINGATHEIANTTNATWCATNFDGFSDADLGTVGASLSDLSYFNKLTDRMQQGFVNFMMLGRAMASPAAGGFATLPAFTMTHNGITPITPGSAIDTSAGPDTRGYYYGISQGGIMGGALTAIDPDVDRGVLGVPAMNYSTLLPRSVDFDEYANGVLDLGGPPVYLPGVGLYDNYTNDAELPVILSVMQLLWDRGEANGYAAAMNPANPQLPNTNPHTVLLELANGDHQVANIAAEVEARTLGAKLYEPSLVGGRSWTGQSFGIDTFTPPLASGNAIVYYDGGPTTYTSPSPDDDQGSGVAPIANVPPRPQWGYGGDPHGYPRRSPDGVQHVTSYLKSGSIAACASSLGCFSNQWNGSAGMP